MNNKGLADIGMSDPGSTKTTEKKIILEAKDIHKRFHTGGDQLIVLEGVNLKIRQGSIIAIFGASGVGKSTLLYILGTLDRPTSGQVVIDATNVFDLEENQLAEFRNRTVGFVFQGHHLLPEFSAQENVMMPMLIGRQDWASAKVKAENLLQEVGLSERVGHKPGELSGGEQQRVAVARALAGSPQVILADEPSGNLDKKTGVALFEMISALSRTYHQAFVIVTHDEGIGRRADHMYELADGRLTDVTSEHKI